MIEISRKSWLVTIRTVFFGNGHPGKLNGADLIGCVHSAQRNKSFDVVRTLHVDLSLDTPLLFAALSKSTKNQINRAAKLDRLRYTAIRDPAESDILAFQAFYNAFARGKGTTLCRPYHVETLKLLMQQDGLVITYVCEPEGRALCYHVYVADGVRAMLLYSGSQFRATEDTAVRSRLARAHRFLHWNDILFFKAQAFAIYDFGGLTDDPQIEQFKRSFGGFEVTEYTGYVPITWRGKVASNSRALLAAIRRRVFSPR